MAEESRTVRDPICGKEVDTFRARAVGIYRGVTYYFCSPECKSKYVNPRKNPPAARPDGGPERRSAMRTGDAPLPAEPPRAVQPDPAAPSVASGSLPSMAEAALASEAPLGAAYDEDDSDSSGPIRPSAGRSPVVWVVLGLVAAAGAAALLLR